MNDEIDEFVKSWYSIHYSKVNSSANPKSAAFRIMHSMIESPYDTNSELAILEIGCNNGEHIDFVAKGWKEYIACDIRIPAKNVISAMNKKNVKFIQADIMNLPFENNHFDRVIITCLLHHLSNPIESLLNVRKVLKLNGNLDLLLPNDPGILYRLIKYLTSGRRAKKYNVYDDLKKIDAIEHRNHYLSLMQMIKIVFQDDVIKITSFPFLFNNFNLNAITIIKVKKI